MLGELKKMNTEQKSKLSAHMNRQLAIINDENSDVIQRMDALQELMKFINFGLIVFRGKRYLKFLDKKVQFLLKKLE